MIRLFDSGASVTFVPASELNMRVEAALERGDGPDVFMVYAESLPDLAENKKIADLSNYTRTSSIKFDEMLESARRACVYQGKTVATPMFTDVYMLATNRALVPVPPQSIEQLKAEAEKLTKQQMSVFDKLKPNRKSLLFEALLGSYGGEMLNSRKTSLTFTSEEGKKAMDDCIELLKSEPEEPDAIGSGKAAFSVLTAFERNEQSQKFPDADIELSPLFGLDRLQTVAIAINEKSQDKARAFKLLEFLETESAKIAAQYKCYSASKNIKPITAQDVEIVKTLASAAPAPDLCGYESLLKTYIPAAIEKAEKGVPASDALNEAAESARGNIWKGKRE